MSIFFFLILISYHFEAPKPVVPPVLQRRTMFWEAIELSIPGNISHLFVTVHIGLHFLNLERLLKGGLWGGRHIMSSAIL